MSNNTVTKGVPEAREALNRFKYEVASEIGVPLKQGYNGDLTSAQNGYVGGYMVNIVCPGRTMEFTRRYKWADGHSKAYVYNYSLRI